MNPTSANILQSFDVNPDQFVGSPNLPHVWTGTVPTTVVVDLWFALRRSFGQSRVWPIIRGTEPVEYYGAVETDRWLAEATTGDPAAILRTALDERRAFLAGPMNLPVNENSDVFALAKAADDAGIYGFVGSRMEMKPWPTEPASKGPGIQFAQLQINPGPSAYLSLVDLDDPYESPAYLGFNGGESTPGPEIQVAMFREWNRQFGAVPAVISNTVIECVVDRPPQNESSAMGLAVDQWLFCQDIVGQGTQSVRNLAIELWRAPQWFFWWD